MSSVDPDDRLLDALRGGEGRPDAGRPEAAALDEADADLDALGRLGRAARALSADDLVLDEPPPAVWAGIAAAVEADAAGDASPGAAGWVVHEGGAAREPAPPPSDTRPSAATPEAAPPPSDTRPSAATPPGEAGPRHARAAPARTRPRPAGWLLAAVAAVTLLVVAVAAALITGGDGGDVVASARLQPLQQVSAVTAEVVEGGDGAQLVVPLDDAGLPRESAAFYEVWLIDSNIQGMVSLGPMRADGTYDIPPGVDFHRYPVVDVSIEPTDGNPTHSSNSVLRGTLS